MTTADADPTTTIALLPLIKNKDELPPGKTDHFWMDHGEGSEVGFSLRVRLKASGAFLNTWYHGRRGAGRKALGDANVVRESDARKKARKINARVELGHDVATEREEKRAADRWKLKAMLAEHCDQKAKTLKPSSIAAKRHYLLGRDEPGKCRNLRSKTGMIASYLKPWHNKPAREFTQAHASQAIAACEAKSGVASAGQLRSHLSGALQWALRDGRYGLERNVVVDARVVEYMPGLGRVFTDAEFAALWHHAPEGDARAVVRKLILTGQRRAEVGNMRWSEIDLDAGRWAIPLERLKNRRTRIKYGFGPHVLKVTPMMREVIGSVHRRNRDQMFGLFSKDGFTMWDETKQVLDKVIDGEWSFHDIRTSVASRLGDLETPPFVVEMLLGHVQSGVAGTYNKSAYQKQLDSVIELWHGHLAEVVGWKPPVEGAVIAAESRAET